MPEPLLSIGSRYSRNSRTGLRAATRVYEDLSNEAQCDAFVDPDPPLGLEEVDRDGVLGDDGRWQLTIKYEGLAGGEGTGLGASAFGEQWSIQFAEMQSPIQAFRDWTKFAKKYGAIIDDDGQLKGFPAKIKIGGQLVANPAYGVDSFADARAILTVRIVAAQTDESWFDNLGKIDVPKPQRFRLPSLKDGRNWRKAGVQAEQRGNAVEGEIAWALSGEGGWLADIYLPR